MVMFTLIKRNQLVRVTRPDSCHCLTEIAILNLNKLSQTNNEKSRLRIVLIISKTSVNQTKYGSCMVLQQEYFDTDNSRLS